MRMFQQALWWSESISSKTITDTRLMQDQGVEAEGTADGETRSVCGTPIYFV